MDKFYLKVEIRYTEQVPSHYDGEELFTPEYRTEMMHSDTFDTEKECIDYGNAIIARNAWMRQNKGSMDSWLKRRLGHPLCLFAVTPGNKRISRADIFISVKQIKVTGAAAIEVALQKFKK